MNFNPTLQNFKDLLGNVNDGNVVFKEDGSGLEKANHGNAISRKLYNYRQVQSDPVKNQQIRQALMDAISNSSEGKTLSELQKDEIKSMLGIGDEVHSQADLTRKELKTLLDRVELMARGEDPDRIDGRIRASIKNIPSVDTNLLVKEQLDRLADVGYDPENANNQRIIASVKRYTQKISLLMSDDFLGNIFEKGFAGHTKDAMIRFVHDSAAHIQSQIFDKLLWKCFDADEGKTVMPDMTAKDVFLKVIEEMTTSWAKGTDPRPVIDSMLYRTALLELAPLQEGPAKLESLLGEPNGPVALAGREFLKDACGRVGAVLGGLVEKFNAFSRLLTPDPTGFDSSQLFMLRQMKSFASQVGEQLDIRIQLIQREGGMSAFRKQLYTTFKSTYESAPGTVQDKKQAAMKAVADCAKAFDDSLFSGAPVLSALNAFDSKLMTTCIGKSALANGAFKQFAAVLGRQPAKRDGVIDIPTLATLVGQMNDKFGSLFDMMPIARVIAGKIGFDKDDAAMLTKICGALENLPDDFAKSVAELRVSLAVAKLTDPNAKAEILVGDKIGVGLVKKIKDDISDGIDPKQVERARNEQFEKAGTLLAAYDAKKEKVLADTFVVTRAEAEEMKASVQTSINRTGKNLQKYKEDLNKLEGERDGLVAELSALAANDPAYKAKSDLVEEKKKAVDAARKKVEDAELTQLKNNRKLKSFDKYDEAYYNIVEKDLVFRGKLVLANECGLLDGDPELYAIATGGRGSLKITPDNAVQVKAKIDRLFADKSLTDLMLMTGYVADGFSCEDDYIATANLRGDRWIFRGMYFDGRLDFTGVDPLVRTYLLTGVRGCIRGDSNSETYLQANELGKATFEAFYRELREGLTVAVNKANEGKPKDEQYDLQKVLKASSLASENPPDHGEKGVNAKFRANHAYGNAGDRLSIRMFKRVWGLGSGDPAVVRDTLMRVGLTQTDLNSPAGWLKAHRLSMVIWAHGGKAAGAVEWAERVTGKAFDDIRLGDLIGIATSMEFKEAIPDPMDNLKGDGSTIAKFLSGQVTIDEANLKPEDMPGFLEGLRKIAKGEGDSAKVSLFGKSFTVSKCPNGALTAKLDLGEGKTMSIGVARTLVELIAQMENQAVEHADRFRAAQILSILPKPPKDDELIARPRELYSKTLSTLLGLPSVNFAHLSTKDLYDTVRVALDPKTDRKALAGKFEALPTGYNSAETVELQMKSLRATPMELDAVKLPKRVDERLPAEKARAFLSELVMNEDTWTYDTGMKTPGQRVLSLVNAFGDDIRYLKNHGPAILGQLPEILRDDVGKILADFIALFDGLAAKGGNQAKLDACAALETKIEKFVKTSMEKLQVEATKLFGASQGDKRENWQKSLSEIGGTDGLSVATSQGRYTKRLLDNYFKSCDPIEQRAMLANVLRNTGRDSSSGKLVGEMLKGAGPLLQKTLQGLSANTFGPETQIALKDMKSKLLPISDSVIQANLLELVRSSNGEILSIEVKKSLGQATVGQALLCHIRTKSHPISGEDVVIKILRPNVQTAVQREYKVFLDIAKKLDEEEHTGVSQQETFKGRYQTVLKEFDFTLESANVDLCRGVYEEPTAFFGKDEEVAKYDAIHSMDRHHAVPPMSGVLLLQKVEGKPVDRLLEDSRAEVDAILGDIKQTTQLGKDMKMKKTVYRAKTAGQALTAKCKLWNRRKELIEQHAELTKLVDIWMEKALFGDGVFHNDLHPGNVMINGRQVTVIDFGNVSRLNKDQQTSLVFLFTAAMTGNVDDYIKGVEDLLGGEGIDGEKAEKLEATLVDVFAKGSSNDVLARMLAALSALKDNSIAIPEVIHNFAESMARLQSVVDGVVDEILTVETISNQITLENGNLDELKLDPKWDGIHLDILDDLKTALKTFGTPGKPFDFAAVRKAAKEFIDNYGAWKATPKVQQLKKTLVEKVFTQEDGGVAFFNDVVRMMRGLPDVDIHNPAGVMERVRIKSTVGYFESHLRDYVELLKAENPNPAEIKELRSVLVSQFRGMFASVLNCVSMGDPEDPGKGPLIFDSVAPARFVGSVYNALFNRMDMLAEKVAAFFKIPNDEFYEIIEKLSSENPFDKVKGAGKSVGYVSSFRSLSHLKSNLDESSSAQKKVEKQIHTFAQIGHGLTEDELKEDVDPLTSLEMEKIRSCAWEFCYPQSWQPEKNTFLFFTESDENYKERVKGLIEKRGVGEIRLVFKTNLDALKKSLGAEKLTVRQIAYFAQMSVAKTRYLPFGKLLDGYNDDKLAEIAGGDADLKLYLTKLQSSLNAIITQEIKEAEEEAKKKAEEAKKKKDKGEVEE